MDAESLVLVFLAFAAGGIVKGATGAGAPLFAVPVMAALRDVPFAVAVFVLPNIVPNLWQFWLYRAEVSDRRFTWTFAIGGGIGAGLGTIALAGLDAHLLELGTGLTLVAYVVFRLTRPAWRLARPAAGRLAGPMGVLAGGFQGATGLSAPVSLTFLNAVGMARKEFAATASLFFIALGVVQLPAQTAYGIMTPDRFGYGLLALIPMLSFMPVGAWIGERLPPRVFDRLILVLLAVLAARLVHAGLA